METVEQHQQMKRLFLLLKFTFVIVPVVAGFDKFTNFLTDWEHYLNPAIAGVLPVTASAFMMIVGVIEIVAGLIVLKKPEIGGYIVSAWLVCIALTLLAGFMYADVAVRDIVMAISAFSMARMSEFIR